MHQRTLHFRTVLAAVTIGIACLACPGCRQDQAERAPDTRPPVSAADAALAEKYIQIVREHCDTVLEHGRDKYGTIHTPLFVDGLNVRTYEPARWTFDEDVWTLSNLANHQNLFRTLAALSNFTGDESYRDAAKAAIRYSFDHHVQENGLLIWGGHSCYCVGNEEWVGRRKHFFPPLPPMHELKTQFPYYELMWEVDDEKTAQFIRSMWAGHIYDWSNLDFDRHARLKFSPPSPDLWKDQEFDPQSPVGFHSRGRTFFGFGSDLIYSATELYRLDDNRHALDWATHLARRFTRDARHPETGLIPYQYSHREEVDRAQFQFAGAFPDRDVTEATLFDSVPISKPLLALMRISETLPEPLASDYRTMATDVLVAIGKHAYDPDTGQVRTMITDGTDLTSAPLQQDGYFGKKGEFIEGRPVATLLFDYCVAARMTNDPFLWEMARQCAIRTRMGDIGAHDGSGIDLDFTSTMNRPEILIGFLELHRLTARRPYLDMAITIADNILKTRYVNGLFALAHDMQFTRTSKTEALALMHLAGYLTHREHLLPQFLDGHAYFACELKSTDKSYSFDYNVLYRSVNPPDPGPEHIP